MLNSKKSGRIIRGSRDGIGFRAQIPLPIEENNTRLTKQIFWKPHIYPLIFQVIRALLTLLFDSQTQNKRLMRIVIISQQRTCSEALIIFGIHEYTAVLVKFECFIGISRVSSNLCNPEFLV
jgi:hypothetical protein